MSVLMLERYLAHKNAIIVNIFGVWNHYNLIFIGVEYAFKPSQVKTSHMLIVVWLLSCMNTLHINKLLWRMFEKIKITI